MRGKTVTQCCENFFFFSFSGECSPYYRNRVARHPKQEFFTLSKLLERGSQARLRRSTSRRTGRTHTTRTGARRLHHPVSLKYQNTKNWLKIPKWSHSPIHHTKSAGGRSAGRRALYKHHPVKFSTFTHPLLHPTNTLSLL